MDKLLWNKFYENAHTGYSQVVKSSVEIGCLERKSKQNTIILES